MSRLQRSRALGREPGATRYALALAHFIVGLSGLNKHELSHARCTRVEGPNPRARGFVGNPS